MRQILCAGAVFVLMLALPASAGAQNACGEEFKPPAVGAWSQYQMAKKGKAEGTLRFSVVGSERREGKEMRWFEMAIAPEKKAGTVMKMLVPEYPFEPDEMQDIIMKSGDSPAIKIGGPMKGMMKKTAAKNPGLSIAEQCKKMQYVGEENVTVPAGTFPTRHYRDEKTGGEVWIANKLPFGMVKTLDKKDGYTLELAAHGSDATTAITETPQDMFGGN